MTTTSTGESTESEPGGKDSGRTGLRWVPETQQSARPSVFDVGLLGVILGTFWFLGGMGGIGAWIVVAGSWLVFPVIVPFALGQIAVVSIAPDSSAVLLLSAQVSLFGLLVRDVASSYRSSRSVVVFGGLAGATAAVILAVSGRTGIAAGVITSILIFGLASYSLHRYLLLELGLIQNDQ